MSGDTSNALVNLGNLSKPADTLIKKVSSAVGCLYEPFQIKRVAKADVAAGLIRAKGEIEIEDIHRRAMCRFVDEEAKKQENMEQITAQALPMLEESSDPSAIDDDWVVNFFDKCRIVSDGDMQSLWAKVLSGESNTPGAYSKRTVNLLGDMGKDDAKYFNLLCRYQWGWDDGFSSPLIYDIDQQIYRKHSIGFSVLKHLESIGLIHFDTTSGFSLRILPSSLVFCYFGERVEVKFSNTIDNSFEIGSVMFTVAGRELAKFCDPKPVDGFKQFVKEHWQSSQYEVVDIGRSP